MTKQEAREAALAKARETGEAQVIYYQVNPHRFGFTSIVGWNRREDDRYYSTTVSPDDK